MNYRLCIAINTVISYSDRIYHPQFAGLWLQGSPEDTDTRNSPVDGGNICHFPVGPGIVPHCISHSEVLRYLRFLLIKLKT